MKQLLPNFNRKLLMPLILLLGLASPGFAQTVTMSTGNCTAVANEIQFDVFVTNNGPGNLQFNSTVIRFTHSAAILAGGTNTMVFSYVGGSDFPNVWPPINNPAFTYTPATRLFGVSTSTGVYLNGGTCAAPNIAQNETKKLGRFSLKNTAQNFVPGADVGLVWNTTSIVNAYISCAAGTTGFNTVNGNRTLATPCTLFIPPSCTSPTINSNPTDQTICTTGTAIYTASFTGGNPVPTLVWQEQVGGVGLFTDLTETAPYSGTTTNTLTITTPNISLSTNRYRLRANNTCGDVFTNSALLTINSNANAGVVSGTSPLCIGATTTYTSNGDGVGTWSSTNTAVATVNAAGLVTALSAGTTDITYTVSTGCNSPVSSFKTLTVSANANAGTVSGTSPLCIGATATYTSNGDGGGTWSSTNTSVATVDAAGLVTALSTGTTDITYTTVGGCNGPVSSFKTLTVSPNANAGVVSGISPLCIGATATYTSNGDGGGTWSSTNTAVATVDAAGLVTALTAGTTDITYTVSTGCNNPVSSFKTLTVSPNANAGLVSGTSPLCIGATATYTSNGDGGGTWSSTNTAVATVDAAGLVTALTAGTTDITYTVSTGCNNSVSSFKTLTVSPNANAGTVSGTSPLCIGATTTYTSNGDGGGTWSSTNSAVATVDAAGFVTALTAGTTDITYTVSTGCNNPVSSFKTLTVSPNVNAGTVSGTSPLCIAATATYSSNGDAGGTWSSTNTAVATVDAAGLVTGVSQGTSSIVYTINSGCGSPVLASQTVTVQALDYANLQFPASGTICPGGSLTAYGQVYEPGVTEAAGQGAGITVDLGYSTTNTNPSTWTNWQAASFNVQVGNNDEYMATFGSALPSGTYYYTFRYSLNGCGYQYGGYSGSGGHFWDGTNYVSGVLTVSPNANAGIVSGPPSICVLSTATYTSNGDAGGTWSSTNPLVATVDAGGVVTALLPGTTDITYTVSTGCNNPVSSFKTITVSLIANAGTVSGTSPLCIGATATYTSDGNAGGVWSSTNPAVASVDAAGLVTALTAGTTDITYTVSGTCVGVASSLKTLTVSPNANAGTVSGTSPLCIGATTTYTSDGDGGGTWSSTNIAVATVDAAGLVTAVTAGTTDITYTVSTGCNNPVSSFKTLTVSANANAGTVSGTSPLCIGTTDPYTSNGDGGGTWSSTNTAVATVDAAGLVTALTAGTTDITYTVSTGCNNPVSSFKTLTVSANANAGTVSGTSPLCIGATATYTSNGDGGGTWSSTNTSVATVDAAGLVTALTAGTTDITYNVSTGCNNPVSSFKTLTVSLNANAGTLNGTSPLCVGNTTTYSSNGDVGGVWSSTNPAVASVSAGGVVSALSTGTTDITYTVNTGCNSPVSSFKTLTVNGSTALAGVAGGSIVCSNATVQPTGTYYSDASCNAIANIAPSGIVPASGNINTCVSIEDVVHTYHNIPYVQRHYDIVPSVNAATATATLTLYYTQGEFDAFNLARGAYPAMPIDQNDLVGISNLRVTQFHGTGTYPGNYTGTSELIDPADNNIVWNSSMNRWEVTFDVIGFSGFYLFTDPFLPLPVTLLSFNGRNNGNNNLLEWSTSSEQNSSYFDLQRSTDGINFVKAGTIAAAGNSSVTRNYNYNDDIAAINANLYYYRLKMVDITGSIKYSTIVRIRLNSKGFIVEATPNPFSDQLRVSVETPLQENAHISLTDMSGRKIQQIESLLRKGSNAILLSDLRNIPSGAYLLTITTDSQKQTVKVVKQ